MAQARPTDRHPLSPALQRLSLTLLFTCPQCQSHAFGPEEPLIHLSQVRADAEGDRHPTKHISLEIDTRRNFGHGETVREEANHAALRDEGDVLTALSRHAATEGHVLDLRNELRHRAVVPNREFAVVEHEILAPRAERPTEHQVSRRGRDVDESAGARGYMRFTRAAAKR